MMYVYVHIYTYLSIYVYISTHIKTASIFVLELCAPLEQLHYMCGEGDQGKQNHVCIYPYLSTYLSIYVYISTYIYTESLFALELCAPLEQLHYMCGEGDQGRTK